MKEVEIFMIFLSGRRSSGKTTAGKILVQKGFWFFDTGPFWRTLRDNEYPDIDVEDYFELKRSESGLPDWEDQLLARKLIEEYNATGSTKKDLIVSGYRSFEELKYLIGKTEGILFPNRPIQIWYIECPFDVAYQRYKEREGQTASKEDLMSQYQYEDRKGIAELRANANRIIFNGTNIEYLEKQISSAIEE